MAQFRICELEKRDFLFIALYCTQVSMQFRSASLVQFIEGWNLITVAVRSTEIGKTQSPTSRSLQGRPRENRRRSTKSCDPQRFSSRGNKCRIIRNSRFRKIGTVPRCTGRHAWGKWCYRMRVLVLASRRTMRRTVLRLSPCRRLAILHAFARDQSSTRPCVRAIPLPHLR